MSVNNWMRVTLIAPVFPLKSISPYCYRLIQALSHYLNFECIIFSRTTLSFFYSGGEIDTTLQPPSMKNINKRVKINIYNPLTWLKAGLYASGDIVHLQHWKCSTTAIYCIIVPILKLRGKKIVFSIHNITPHAPEKYFIFLDALLNRFVFRFADSFIVHNKRNKKRFEELYQVNQRPISVIGVGSHEPLIRTKLSRKEAREHLYISMEKKVILHFGYIWRYKGVDVLLNALESIVKNVPNVILVLAGTVTSDWKQYEEIIEKKHLAQHIQLHLHYIPESEVDIYFSAADLVVLPYTPPFDTHGGVGALAVALHKPLLVSDIGGLTEYVRNSQAIVTPGDVNELAKKTIKILTDKKLLSSLVKDSRTIAKEITWDEIAKKTIRVYEQMTSTS
jgi:glycosyltransferase involved in cell wall biosynthesis